MQFWRLGTTISPSQMAISSRGMSRRGHSIDVESQPVDRTHFRIWVLPPPMCLGKFHYAKLLRSAATVLLKNSRSMKVFEPLL